MNIDSIIFDLDGTLWDSSEEVVKAWNHILKENKDVKNSITKEDIEGVMGLQAKDIGEKLFPYESKDIQDNLVKSCCEYECKHLSIHGGSLYDNLEQTLNILSKKYKLFIVSNCQCGYIEAFYEFHKLDKYFSDFENPGRTGLSKGENIRLIIERNNLNSAIYVGDTEGDLKSARFARIPFVYASYGFGEVKEYDYKIGTINELIQLVEG